MIKKILPWLALLAVAVNAPAQTKTLLNLDKSGVALQGYDPVAFFTDGKPLKGDAKFATRHNGATYWFATPEHKELFTKDSAKYEPAFGGFCAYGVSCGKTVNIDVNAWQVVEGRLLLQYSKGVRDDFNKDAKGNLAKADANWPELVAKKGK